jgi:hypothetical protein
VERSRLRALRQMSLVGSQIPERDCRDCSCSENGLRTVVEFLLLSKGGNLVSHSIQGEGYYECWSKLTTVGVKGSLVLAGIISS